MAKNYFNRYVWLIDTIRRHGYITFSDISSLWRSSALNEDGSSLPERTFFNHRDAIRDIFGIEIRFDKSLGYYLSNDDLGDEGIRGWLLTSLSVNNLISESAELRDRIIFENIPSGEKYLTVIIEAMKEGKVLEMSYKKFTDSEERTYDVAPYCVKVYKQRWYMVAAPIGGNGGQSDKPFIYALDRIQMLQQTRMDFQIPENFSPNEYFSDRFGIVHDERYTPVKIRLKVWDRQRHYIRTLPLHHSQREVETTEEWSIFEYFMSPSWNLEQELLQYNDQVEVLEPQSLRDMMIEHAWNMLHLYNEA